VPTRILALPALPRTPSGKLDPAALLAPDPTLLGPAPFVAPRTPTEAVLAAVFAIVLGRDTVGVDDDFFALGGDSIDSIRIATGARQAGLDLRPGQLFAQPTIAALAAVVAPLVPEPDGPLPLTPVQRALLAGTGSPASTWEVRALALPDSVDADVCGRALVAVVAHHAALRVRIAGDGADARQVPDAEAAPSFVATRLEAPDADGRRAALASETERLLARLAGDGALVGATLVDFGAAGRRLLLAASALAMDGPSWEIVLGDLATAAAALVGGRTPVLDPSASFAEAVARTAHVAVAAPAGTAPAGDVRIERRVFSAADADALVDAPSARHRARPEEVLIAMLVHASAHAPTVGVAFDRSLRVDADLARTVGPLTSPARAVLATAPECTPTAVLKAVKEDLRGPSADDRAPLALRVAYRERRAGFAPAPEGADAAPETTPGAAIEVHAVRRPDGLEIVYSGPAARIEALADGHERALRALAAGSDAAGAYTVSDFPRAGLDQRTLEAVVARLAGRRAP
jgi:hypothetical protein